MQSSEAARSPRKLGRLIDFGRMETSLTDNCGFRREREHEIERSLENNSSAAGFDTSILSEERVMMRSRVWPFS